MSSHVPKVSQKDARYREFEFLPGQCQFCRYFLPQEQRCRVVDGPIRPDFVSDLFQGREASFRDHQYQVKNFGDFIRGMEKTQPYQHIVVGGFNTPEGYVVIIKDTMKPKPHVFSLSQEFHILHTSQEHHWTQEEVDRIEEAGRES